MDTNVRKSLEIINNVFISSGKSIWLVGGCVRDIVMGKIPKDYDLATDSHPHIVLDICQQNNIATYKTGIQYGTITLVINDISFEVTTFRKDALTSDGRRPDYVEFADNILDDLSRRDFKMNAMALYLNDYLKSNFSKDMILDPYGGLEDIRNEEINCVGNPMDRFDEDALRIMRAIRFSTKYNFLIGKETLEALYKSHNKLINVSTERITSEFNQILLNFNLRANDLQDEKYLNKWRLTNFIIKKVIPEMYALSEITHNNSYHLYDVYTHSLLVCAGVNTKNITVKLAALLHDIGKMTSDTIDTEKLTKHFYRHAEKSVIISKCILERMKYSNDEIDTTLKLIEHHDVELQDNKKSIKRLLNKVGENLFEELLDIKLSDKMNHIGLSISNDEKFNMMKIYKEILYNEEVFSIKDLVISGNDLIDLGYEPSPLFSEILNDCVNLCINKPHYNTKECLLEYVYEKY